MFGSQRGPYRSRSGLIFGVCAGLAEFLDISVFWTRVITLVAFVVTGIWPVGVVYLGLALLLKKSPWVEAAPGRCKGKAAKQRQERHGNLDERIRNLESIVTRADQDWDARLRNS